VNTIATALVISAVLGAPVFTQDSPQPPQTRQASQQPRTPQAAQAPQAERERQPAEERERTPPPPPAPAERRPLPTRNVKVDITITEQDGVTPPAKKVVSLVVADGRSSNIRSQTNAPIANGSSRELFLNVDASVNLTPEQRVLLDLRFLYTGVSVMSPLAGEGRAAPATPEEKAWAAPRPGNSSIQDSLTVLLTPGTPLVVARSADAASDRIVTVEVKAEILK